MNLFALPPAAPGEVAEPLWENSAFRLERIVSRGDVSPAGFWYDQEETEWVSLLSGCALLEFSGCIVFLERGDTLRIPAHKKHRVAATSVSPACIWLCLFGKEREGCGS